ncbi:hypothetical protein GCM10009558_080530 [Virgisporangium aurantiacum]
MFRGPAATILTMRVWLDSLRRPTVLVNVVLALVAVGGALWAGQTVRGPATAEAGTGSAQQRVIPVTQGDVTASVSASGNVQSASTATANFVTSGTVTEIAVKVGDVVTKGQVLAKVDTTLVQAQLDTARANRTAAGANYTRVKDARWRRCLAGVGVGVGEQRRRGGGERAGGGRRDRADGTDRGDGDRGQRRDRLFFRRLFFRFRLGFRIRHRRHR